MHSAIRRVLVYMAIMAGCIAVAVWTTETRTAFIAIFATGLVFGVAAELLFWLHIFRVTRHRSHR